MTYVVTDPEDVAGISRTHLAIKADIFLFMEACDQAPFILPKMQDQYSLTLHWRWFSRLGREGFTFSFCYKGSHLYVYRWVISGALQITQDTRPTIVDARLTHIFRMSEGAFICTFWLQRRPMQWQWTASYQYHYFTILSSISDCEHNCETRSAELEIVTDESCQTG